MPAKDGDLYFSVESYFNNMIPPVCTTGTYESTNAQGQTVTGSSTKPLLYFALYDAANPNTILQYKYYMEQYQKPMVVLEADYSANTVFLIGVKYLWFGSPFKDYTVKVYTK